MVSNGLLKTAITEARKSKFRQKIGAVIIKKKTVISKGHNFKERAAKKLHPKYTRWETSIHAETDAILKAKRPLKGTYMIIVRVNTFDELKLARPCNHCMAYIKRVGIRKIYYTVNSTIKNPKFKMLKL